MTTTTIPSGDFPTISNVDALKTRLWDNVFGDLLLQTKKVIRQSCLQLIVAINYIEKSGTITEDVISNPRRLDEPFSKADQVLQRLANARVVVSPAFTSPKEGDPLPQVALRRNSFSKQEARHSALTAQFKCLEMTDLYNDLLDHIRSYNESRTVDLVAKLKTHEANVDSQVSTYLSRNPDVKTEMETDRKNAGYTSEIYIPEDVGDEFRHAYDPPFASASMSGASALLRAYIIDNSLQRSSITEVLERVQREKAKCDKQTFADFGNRSTKAIVNGVPVELENVELYDFTVSFITNDPSRLGGEIDGLYISLFVGYDNAVIVNSSFQFVIVDGQGFPLNSAQLISNKHNSILLRYEFQNPVIFDVSAQFTLSGTVELALGKEIALETQGYIGTSYTSSNGALTSSALENTPLYYGINAIGVADFRRVEQELCCYVPGEVAHIENIMQGEFKDKRTRSLNRSETSVSFSSENERSTESEVAENERNAVFSEVSSVVNEDRQFRLGFNASVGGGKEGGFHWGASVSGDFARARSKSDSNTTARDYAEDVTRRAVQKASEKITISRQTTSVREFEETNRQGFDNREGTGHVSGVYRWVDKVYDNRLVNYGKRLIYEFSIPEPARFYKRAVIIEAEENGNAQGASVGGAGESSNLIKPTHPKDIGMLDASSISRENWEQFASHYSVEVPAPLDEHTSVTVSCSEVVSDNDSKLFTYPSVNIDSQYESISAEINGNGNWKSQSGPKAEYFFTLLGVTVGLDGFRGGHSWHEFVYGPFSVGKSSGLQELRLATVKFDRISAGVKIKCRLKQSFFQQWQQECYSIIMSAYEAQLERYNQAEEQRQLEEDARRDEANAGSQATLRNPQFNKLVVHNELKRLSIELMLSPFNVRQGRNFYKDSDAGIPAIQLGEALNDYATLVKFMEQAFDWNLLSEEFFPYYWAHREDWKALFQSTDSEDQLFQAFLQSGMAQLSVPVSQGYEDAVLHFMETGKVWQGIPIVFDTDNDLQVSIADELNTVDGQVESTWQTVVPSNLVVLQSSAVGLDAEGLPCCDATAELPFEPNLNVLPKPSDTPAT